MDKTIDDDLVRDMILCADNDRAMYCKRKPYQINAMRRIVKGTYDAEKAVTLWSYYANQVRRWYAKENGIPLPSKAEMLEMARHYADGFENLVRDGSITPEMLGVKGNVPEGF